MHTCTYTVYAYRLHIIHTPPNQHLGTIEYHHHLRESFSLLNYQFVTAELLNCLVDVVIVVLRHKPTTTVVGRSRIDGRIVSLGCAHHIN